MTVADPWAYKGRKSYLVAIFLAFIFGPFGAMYASVGLGFMSILIAAIAAPTIGAGFGVEAATLTAWACLWFLPIGGSIYAVHERNAKIDAAQAKLHRAEREEAEQRAAMLAAAGMRGGS